MINCNCDKTQHARRSDDGQQILKPPKIKRNIIGTVRHNQQVKTQVPN